MTFVAEEDYGFYLECLADAAARAGVYPWSSYAAHAESAASNVLADHLEYTALGASQQARQAAYRALFDQALDDRAVVAIRYATNKAWPLGNDRFKEELARLIERRVAPAPHGRPRKGPRDEA